MHCQKISTDFEMVQIDVELNPKSQSQNQGLLRQYLHEFDHSPIAIP